MDNSVSLVSIVVPIYKVEEYLPRCVNSLLAQTYKKFELILVDDGSPDRCGEICEEYARKDNRVKVIHKPNGGLSDARNAGLAIAKGDYIAFVDSDDWVAPGYLSCMLEVLQKSDSDICECEVLRTYRYTEDVPFVQNCTLQVFKAEAALKHLICDQQFHQYVWNKLYKRKCIEGIIFKFGKTNEDEFWTYQVFGRANKVAKINEVLYFYYQREGSIMGTGYNLKRLDALEAKKQRQMYIEKNFPALSDLSKTNLFASCVYAGQMSLKFLKGEDQKKASMIIDQIQKENHPGKKAVAQLFGSEKLWVQMAKMDFWGTCRVKNLLKKGF